MNDKKMACVLLLALIGGMVYGTQQMRNRATAAKDAALFAEDQAAQKESLLQISEINLKRIEEKTKELRDTYDEWVPYLSNFATTQEAESSITDLVRNSGVFLIEQRFDTKELDKKSAIPTSVTGKLIFEDDFAKTMNFLGKLEQSLPALRITNCRMIRGDRGNNINLELSVELPIVSHLPGRDAVALPVTSTAVSSGEMNSSLSKL